MKSVYRQENLFDRFFDKNARRYPPGIFLM